MNRDNFQNSQKFQEFINKTRDCDAELLDSAVSKGISCARAKDERLDFRKIFNLTAMYAAAAVMGFAVNLEPVISVIASELMPGRNIITQSGAEVLYGYLVDFVITAVKYLGGI